MGCCFKKKRNNGVNNLLEKNYDNFKYKCPECKEEGEINMIYSDTNKIKIKCSCPKSPIIEVQKYIEKLDDVNNNNSDKKDDIIGKNNGDDKIYNKIKILCEIIKLNKIFLNTYRNYPNNYYHLMSVINIGKYIEEENDRNNEEFEKIIKIFEKKKIIHEITKKKLKKKYNIEVNGDETKIDYFIYAQDENKTKPLENEGFILLSKIMFTQLKEMDVSDNKIKNIEPLRNMILPHLEILDMSYNEIEEIGPIAESNYKNLKEIYLQHNNIIEISPFLDSVFPVLEILRIDNNRIKKDSDDFKKLEQKFKEKKLICEIINLSTFKTRYKSTQVFDDKKNNDDKEKKEEEDKEKKEEEGELSEKIKKIYITDIKDGDKMLEDLNLLIPKKNNIERLKISNNNIKNTTLIKRLPLFKLKSLDLALNKITNLDFLTKLKSKKIKVLFLDENQFKNIYQLFNKEKLSLENLKLLSLKGDYLTDGEKEINPKLKDLVKRLNTLGVEVDIQEEGVQNQQN